MAAVFRNARDLQAALKGRGGISDEQRHALARIYNSAAPSLFLNDRAAFRDCVASLYEVDPGFRLSWPKVVRLASGLIGFRAAGALLGALRHLRAKPENPRGARRA